MSPQTPARVALSCLATAASLAGCVREPDPVPVYASQLRLAPPPRAPHVEFRRNPSLPPITKEPEWGHSTPEASYANRPWWTGLPYAPQPPSFDPRTTMDVNGIDLALDDDIAIKSSAALFFTESESRERKLGVIEGEVLTCGVQITRVANTVPTNFTFPMPLPEDTRELPPANLGVALSFGSFALPGGPPAHAWPQVKGAPRPLGPNDEAELETRAPDTHGIFWVSAPAVRLFPGESITAVVRDTRLPTAQGQTITLRATYDGTLPLRVKEGGALMECRVLPHEARAELTRLALHALDFETDRLDTRELGKMFTGDVYPRATQRVELVASLTGWADPRLALRLARLAQVHRRLVADVTTDIMEKQALLPPPGKAYADALPGVFSVAVVSLACGKETAKWLSEEAAPGESAACLLRLKLRNNGAVPLDTTAHGDHVAGAQLQLSDRFGRPIALHALGIIPENHGLIRRWALLPPHSEIDALFAVERTVGGGKRPTFGTFPPAPEGDLHALRPFMLKAGENDDTLLRVE
jgi:hypothetical protein